MAPGAQKRHPSWLRLVLAAAGTELLYLVLVYAADQTPPPHLVEKTPVFLGLWSGLLVLYAYTVRAVGGAGGRRLTGFLLATSLLFRLSLLPMGSHPPAASIQPPLETLGRHLLELLTPWLGQTIPVTASKLIATVSEGIVLLVAPALLRAGRLPGGLIVVYGWNPLVIKETAGGAHLETVALALLLLALRGLERGSRRWAGLAYGAALTGGPWTAACLPLMLRALGAYAWVSVAIGAGVWSFALRQGLEVLPRGLAPSVGSSLSAGAVSLSRLLVTRDPAYAVFLCGGTWLLLAAARGLRKELERVELPREALLSIGSFLMIAPEVPPWHFIAVACFAPFSRNRGWLVFTATAPLSYWAAENAHWGPWSFGLGFLQYFPPYFALVFSWLGRSAGGDKR